MLISNVKWAYSPLTENKCGLELERTDADLLAESIKSILDMDKESYDQMCANAVEAAKEYDMKVLAKKVDNVIQWVMNRM